MLPLHLTIARVRKIMDNSFPENSFENRWIFSSEQSVGTTCAAKDFHMASKPVVVYFVFWLAYSFDLDGIPGV